MDQKILRQITTRSKSKRLDQVDDNQISPRVDVSILNSTLKDKEGIDILSNS